MTKAPAFQFYADDFMAGTIHMNADEVGVYIRLLCFQWSKGELPLASNKLERIAGSNKDVIERVLAEHFKESEDGWRNERLEKVRCEQAEHRHVRVAFPNDIPLADRRRPDLETKEWRDMRCRVISEDGTTCHYCGFDCSDDVTVDHVVPHSKGGTMERSNLVVACRSCNAKKGNRVA